MKKGCCFCPGTQKTDWHFLRETTPFPNWLIHCEWGELPSSTGASRMSLICTTTSRETESVTESYLTFIFETCDMWCLKLLYLCSYPFCLSLEHVASDLPAFSGSASMKLPCEASLKLQEPAPFMPIQIAEDVCFDGLQVLWKSTQPPQAVAICISLFKIISAVLKWSDH